MVSLRDDLAQLVRDAEGSAVEVTREIIAEAFQQVGEFHQLALIVGGNRPDPSAGEKVKEWCRQHEFDHEVNPETGAAIFTSQTMSMRHMLVCQGGGENQRPGEGGR